LHLEPETGRVAHTLLSAHFVTSQSLLDASVFTAESAAPAALLHWRASAAATQRFGARPPGPTEGLTEAAQVGGGGGAAAMRQFRSALQERPKLRRQWAAYLCHAAGVQQEEELLDVISRLNWSNLGSACIVEVNFVPPKGNLHPFNRWQIN
jgi:hypothetical protein